MSRLSSLLAAVILLAVTGSERVMADTVTLRDGTVREGTIVEEDADTVTMEVRMGGLKGKIVLHRYEIAAVKKQPLPPDPVETEATRLRTAAQAAKGKEAADLWVQLGDLYARNAGYSAQARMAYENAIVADPDHVRARHGLGHVKVADGWQKPDELRRERGLVPLGEVWVKPDERSWLIDQRHEARSGDEWNIGPRQAEDFSRADLERALALKRAEDEAKRRDAMPLANGTALLSQYGYYNNDGPYYIGSGGTSVWADGVGVDVPGYSSFFGTVGTGSWYGGYGPYYGGRRDGRGCGPRPGPYASGGGWGAMYGGNTADFRRANGFSPGFRAGNFMFGTSFGGYGGWGGYGGGWGVNLNGGSGSTRWNLNMGGFSGSSSYRSSTGIGFFGF